jgi:fibronectin type 3 domain-containing protein
LQKKPLTLAVSLLVALALLGCGKKGDPVPMATAVPATVGDFRGDVKDGVLFLSFTVPTKNQDGSPLTDLAGFRIFKSCTSCMGPLEPLRDIYLDGESGFTIYQGRLYFYDDDLVPGYQYSYRLYPLSRAGGRGNPSNIFTVSWAKTPDPPSNISVRTGDGMVELRWPQESGYLYNVYRYEGDTYPLIALNEKPLAGGTFFDRGLENNRLYRYNIRKVQERQGIRWEGRGTTVEATPADRLPPPAPFGLQAERHRWGVVVAWEGDPFEEIAGYNIYRTAGGKRQKLNDEPVEMEMFVDSNPPDVRYVFYGVTAVDGAGNESDPSREIALILKDD